MDNLIVVDGFSTDKTLEIIDNLNEKQRNVTVLKVNGSRAKARQAGIRHVDTEWFMFVDSDVVLSRDWFRKAEKRITPNVGAVWGVNIDVIASLRDKHFVKLQSLIARQCFSLRGGTHDTLIRHEAVAGISIPEQLHAYEDSYIMNAIEKNGFKIVVCDDVYCLHFKPPGNWNFENAISQAILEFKCGMVYSHQYLYAMYYPFFLFYWFLQLPLQGSKNFLAP